MQRKLRERNILYGVVTKNKLFLLVPGYGQCQVTIFFQILVYNKIEFIIYFHYYHTIYAAFKTENVLTRLYLFNVVVKEF